MVHPQWSLLDPNLHTPTFVRGRSALLTTALCAVGATALATLPDKTDERVAEAIALHAHVEKLNLVVYMTGAKSVEIMQAQILLCRYGQATKTQFDEKRWQRAAIITRMAAEIGLHIPRDYADHKLRFNDVRTRAFLLINEYRFVTWR